MDHLDTSPEIVKFFCNYSQEEKPAKVHFALPKSFHYHSIIIITLVVLISVSILCVGMSKDSCDHLILIV
jgi:hypothetical protein